jgi:RNA polymerase sigma-70 factor (ECF subfamily)
MQRAILTMIDIEDMSLDQVCNILAISSSNARVLLHRARVALHQSIDDYQGRS